MGDLSKERGFTIVELLIVVVVIAILAAITIVSYNGITKRAKISRTEVELSTLSKSLELFKADNGRYPNVVPSAQASTVPMVEMEEVLRQANLFTVTRADYTSDPRQFVYCTNSDASDYIIAALKPIYTGEGIPLTEKIYYKSSKFFQEVIPSAAITSPSVGIKICQAVAGDSSFSLSRWAHDIPLPYSS